MWGRFGYNTDPLCLRVITIRKSGTMKTARCFQPICNLNGADELYLGVHNNISFKREFIHSYSLMQKAEPDIVVVEVEPRG